MAEYRIRGAKGLNQAVEQILGSLIALSRRNAVQVSVNDEGASLVKEFWSIVEKVDRIGSVALKEKQLADGGAQLLQYLPFLGAS